MFNHFDLHAKLVAFIQKIFAVKLKLYNNIFLVLNTRFDIMKLWKIVFNKQNINSDILKHSLVT